MSVLYYATLLGSNFAKETLFSITQKIKSMYGTMYSVLCTNSGNWI